MWQVYLYLANERHNRERDTRARDRARRWPFGRRERGADVTNTDRSDLSSARTSSSVL
ncbi:MAG: hypothetical protein ABWZ82_01200 [Candidatus Limnocylindrales bacterium]